MQPLIDNARLFGQHPEESARIEGRGDGGGPSASAPALRRSFITCSDSRVVHALITGAGPAELFELRTAGNPVPPYASAIPTGRHFAVPSGNARDPRREPGTLDLVTGS
ncbi:carbonic anhydrase [Streptomyces sp. NPDC029044]|uniref:carbonic anhydrase n=1 Tax=Streptomyces sp. NPDC029044 TaxID=3157198 RepID=UPI0033EC9A39